jgi:arylsulfatase
MRGANGALPTEFFAVPSIDSFSTLARLEDLGLAEDTIVIFTSDHGEWLSRHFKYGKGYPGHACVTRVPLIVRWPGKITRAGHRISDIVEGVDVLPTRLECAAVQRPNALQGRSFFPALEGRA